MLQRKTEESYTSGLVYHTTGQDAIKEQTFVAANRGVPLVARKTSTDGAMVNHMALSMYSTVTWCDTTFIQTSSVAGTLTVGPASHT